MNKFKSILFVEGILFLILFSCSSVPSDDGSNLSSSSFSSSSSSSSFSFSSSYPYEPDEKHIALTFDDGPDSDPELTSKVLDKLEQYGVVATFFVVGSKVNSTTISIMQRAKQLGCEFGNHSWNYESLTNKDSNTIIEYISNTSRVIENAVGGKPLYFRPPNLAVNSLMYSLVDMPFIGGYTASDWTRPITAEQIYTNVMANLKDGAIILLHDVQPKPHPTPDALDLIIPELKAQGYKFVTISQLFQAKGVTPTPHQKKMWVVITNTNK